MTVLLSSFAELRLDAGLIIVIATVFVAGFLRGFIGFGAALISMPIISLVYGPLLAVAIVTVMGIPSTFQLLPDAIKYSEKQIIGPMALAIFSGSPIGTSILVAVDPAIMKIVIAGLVLLMVAFLWSGWRMKEQINHLIVLFAGFVGGFTQGVSGMGGPPVVAVALSRAGPPEKQRGNVLAVMTAITFSAWLPLYFYDLLTPKALAIGIVLMPVYSLSTWIGGRYFSGAGKAYYRRAALVLLAIIGVATLGFATWDFVDIR